MRKIESPSGVYHFLVVSGFSRTYRGPPEGGRYLQEQRVLSMEPQPSRDLYSLVRAILTSRVYDVARETPLDAAPRLSARLDNTILLKREDLQPIFSFKIRGAYNRIVRLTTEERERGVIAASAGNHAQGV